MGNIVDPDQTAPSGSAMFALTCLSKNLGSDHYIINRISMTRDCWSLARTDGVN